ncbi:MAG TPA: helix-hairpin-helix domain-containing protein, partial [Chloroflexota bacterium]|nr:helix-hairpin-helix domain-containing protein [Chloroflexota bacterium]
LAAVPAPDPRRRARLYQWEWLATSYDFSDRELDSAFDATGHLPLALDPKLAVSLAHPMERPVEVNTASYEELLRVPGIGPISARRIADLRRLGLLREMSDLRSLGVVAGRAAPFVLLNGIRPPEAAAALTRLRKLARVMGPRPIQLTLWPEFG